MIVKIYYIFAIFLVVGISKINSESYIQWSPDVFEIHTGDCYISICKYILEKSYYSVDELKHIENKKILLDTYFNLLRVYRKAESFIMLCIEPYIWKLFRLMNDWILNNSAYDMMVLANEILNLHLNNNLHVKDVDSRITYNRCKKNTSLLPTLSPRLKAELRFLFNERGNINPLDLNTYNVPDLIQYGFILLLIKEDEISAFISYETNSRKIYIIDMMIDAITDICSLIIQVYYELRIQGNRTKPLLDMLNDVHKEIVNTTVMLYAIHEIRRGYFRIKRSNTDPLVTEKNANGSKLFRMYSKYINKVNGFMNMHENYILNKELEYEYTDRLVTVDDNMDRSILVPMMEYYQIDTEKPSTNELYDIMCADKKAALLFDLYTWTRMIRQFATMMKDDNDILHNVNDFTQSMVDKFGKHKNLFFK